MRSCCVCEGDVCVQTNDACTLGHLHACVHTSTPTYIRTQDDVAIQLTVVHGSGVPATSELPPEPEPEVVDEQDGAEAESEEEDPPDGMLTRPEAERFVLKRGYHEDPGEFACALRVCLSYAWLVRGVRPSTFTPSVVWHA